MIYKQAINIPAIQFGAVQTVTFRPGKAGSIRITKPSVASSSGLLKWDAYSWWNNDVGDGISPVPGQTWNNAFTVWGSNDSEPFVKIWDAYDEGFDSDLYATSAQAFAAIAALLPITFDGYDTYEIRNNYDDNPPDNRNGLSLIVEMATGVLSTDILPHQPDAPIKEEWSWLTDIQVSYNGTEDRIPLNVSPKRTFSGNYSFEEANELQLYRSIMQKSFGGILRVPLFQYQVKAKAPIVVGDAEIFCNTIRSDFRDQCEALIREGDTWELVVIREVQADRLVMGTTPVNSYSAKALISPVTRVFTATGAQLHRANPDYSGTADFNFREWLPWEPFVNPQESETLTTFDSLTVLDRRAVGSQFDFQFDSGILITDSYIGQADVFNPWSQGQWVFPLRWQCNRLFDIDDWLWWQKFCNAIQGSQTTFLLPSFRSDLTIVNPAVGGGNAVTLKGHQYRDHYYGLDTFSRLVIESAAGRQFVKVTGVSNLSGDDRVSFTPALPAGSEWATDQTIGFLLKVRSADDKVTCDHYGLHTDVSMSIRTVK